MNGSIWGIQGKGLRLTHSGNRSGLRMTLSKTWRTALRSLMLTLSSISAGRWSHPKLRHPLGQFILLIVGAEFLLELFCLQRKKNKVCSPLHLGNYFQSQRKYRNFFSLVLFTEDLCSVTFPGMTAHPQIPLPSIFQLP